jgi:hypothetical protein
MGGTPATMPPMPPTKNAHRARLSIRIDPALKARVDDAANTNAVSLTHYVEDALRHYLDRAKIRNLVDQKHDTTNRADAFRKATR